MMYFILLLILLTSASTVDRLNNSMTVPSTGVMMNHLQKMLNEGTVSNDEFVMVRRALTDFNNPANGPHEAKIHEIINVILAELTDAYMSFTTRQMHSRVAIIKKRDDIIQASKDNTKTYEDEVTKVVNELTSKEQTINQELARLEKQLVELKKQLRQAKLVARKQLDEYQAKVDQANQALEQAQATEEEIINNAHSLYENDIKALRAEGASERKVVCEEYHQMKKLRNDVDKIDEDFESKNIFTPPLIAKICTHDYCPKKCLEDGYTCTNILRGSHQMLSCTQGCDIAQRGTGLDECLAYCQRTGTSGCSANIHGIRYGMCSVCKPGKMPTTPASCEHGCRLIHS